MDTIYDLEVSKEDELLLRNNWKLISTSQFINLFKNVLKIKDAVTPYDLEQSLLRPQHDPLCAELMSRLLQKKSIKKGADLGGSINTSSSDAIQILDYDTWNVLLAKKFSMMYKSYRKFSLKFLGVDPMQAQHEQLDNQQQNVEAGDAKLLEFANSDAQLNNYVIQQEVVNNEEAKEENKENDIVIEEQKIQKDQNNEESKITDSQQIEIRERITRSRLAAKNNNDNENSNKQQKKDNKNQQKKAAQNDKSQQAQKEIPQIQIEFPQSYDVREHLLKSHYEQNLHIRFSLEEIFGYGQNNQLKTESIQIVKLFDQELDQKDPFYILGQDWNQKEDQSNYWSNFVDTENIEDFDDFQFQLNAFGTKGSQIDVQFKKFHEISCKQRLDILYFLCQHKFDSEQPEYMQEIEQLKSSRSYRLENESGQPLKMSEELKQWLEPINMGLLKPLGQIASIVEDPNQQILIHPGRYYYLPFFQDTRIYRQSLDFSEFELFLEEHDQILIFIEQLKKLEENEGCIDIAEKLTSYLDYLKKFADEMKWKEASKVRKLKSQIRSRKLQDNSRKKLQFEGRQSQLQTDFLHHTQKNVMTRHQVDNLKSKINKTGAIIEESSSRGKRETRASGGASQNAIAKYQEQQKEKYEKEKQDRQRRLEKRMRIKERIATGSLGKRKRRGQNSEDEVDYGAEYDDEEQYQDSGNKRQKVDEAEQEADKQQQNQDYEIQLNGQLLMIFQRDQIDPTKIINQTIVIKGNWKMSIEEQAEEFIYKKIAPPEQEELLTELFCENPVEKITLQQHRIVVEQLQIQDLIDKFLECQGMYEGYFKYNDEDVTEKFSFILRKSSKNQKKQVYFDVCGYGENDIGPFTMEGGIQLLPFEKIQEKDGVKGFLKVKLAKFNLHKNYKKKFLEEMVDEAKQERQANKRMFETFPNNQKNNQVSQSTKIKIPSQQETPAKVVYSQEKIYSQHQSQSSLNQTPSISLPKISAMNQHMNQAPFMGGISPLDQFQQLLQSQQQLQAQQPNKLAFQDFISQNPQAQLLTLTNQLVQQNNNQNLVSQLVQNNMPILGLNQISQQPGILGQLQNPNQFNNFQLIQQLQMLQPPVQKKPVLDLITANQQLNGGQQIGLPGLSNQFQLQQQLQLQQQNQVFGLGNLIQGLNNNNQFDSGNIPKQN